LGGGRGFFIKTKRQHRVRQHECAVAQQDKWHHIHCQLA